MRDLNLLHPKIKAKAQRLIQLAKEHGINIVITQTLRTKAEQDELYVKGRTAPGRIVTNAKYPSSPHCWGIAFDFAVMVNGKANWSRTDLYNKVGLLGKSLGLFWGGDFKSFVDRPHFEDPEFVVGKSVKTLIKNWGTPDRFIKSWKEAEPMLKKADAEKIIDLIQAKWGEAKSQAEKDEWHRLADEVRKVREG